ncbi:hypothetical protein DJ030_10850 [bacterium endosymbiont of Escarpia laminata]|nr:MAG: hypothetical protein DJ030_10850 [bacterium endosymbiont of Escarpia laminata]RLJ19624.1 MAG: hypothetical protein DJ031_08235 [bacterium endosymbiont of Escarpia laminata]
MQRNPIPHLPVAAVIFITTFSTQSTAADQIYLCELNGLERRIEIHYQQEIGLPPCEVRYFKEAEQPGSMQILWSADNETGYCEQKAAKFRQKLEGWGWQCAPTPSTDEERLQQ